jgi:EmrB/QacA subfamily drug resistance transporter
MTAAVSAASVERFTSRQRLALAVMCSTIVLISIDASALNVAIPTLVRSLDPSASGLRWIADSYVLTNAVLLLLGGALGDRYGHRLMFTIGLVIFGSASLAASMVDSTWPLVAARSLCGVGAACLVPSTLALIAATFYGQQRARAIGVWASTSGVGSAGGPLVGGWLLAHFWWGSIFLINVPVAVLGAVGARFVLDESRSATPRRIDPVGVVLSAAGLAALTYAFIVMPTNGLVSPEVLGAFGLAVILLVAFIIWDRHQAEPLVDLELFHNRVFTAGLMGITAMFFAMFGVSFLISQYMQFVQGATVFQVGVRFLPLAVLTFIGGNVAPRLVGPYGLRQVITTGLLLIFTGQLILFSSISTTSGAWLVSVAFAFIGAGTGLAIGPTSNAIVNTLAPDKVGAGSAIRSTVQLLGGSFGIAIVGSISAAYYRSHITAAYHGRLRDVPQAARPSISDQIGRAVGAAAHLPAELGAKVTQVADQAFVGSVHIALLVAMPMMLLAATIVWFFLPTKPAPPAGFDAEVPDPGDDELSTSVGLVAG